MNARPQDIAEAGLMGAEDAAAQARFVSLAGQDSRTARLMVEAAELRVKLSRAIQAAADATTLTCDYARLINEHGQPQGIVSLIRRLDSQRLTTEELRAIIAALTLKAGDMPFDMSLVESCLTEAHDAAESPPDAQSQRQRAADERQDTLRQERAGD